jgi:uncharacterized SAM-binding protein YcdF (DUF218 family)
VRAIKVEVGSEPYVLGQTIWDYLRVPASEPVYLPGSPSDILIMVLGSPDLKVADHSASLLRRGTAEKAVISGGCLLGDTSNRMFEADKIADLIEATGVEADRLLRERKSKNTSEHFWKTEALLRSRSDIAGGENPPKFVILVPAPVAERRALETARKRWPTSQFWVDGIPETYQQYMNRTDGSISLGRMVGEVERIFVYPQLQYMMPPDLVITAEVKTAYRRLRRHFNNRPSPDCARLSLRVGI